MSHLDLTAFKISLKEKSSAITLVPEQAAIKILNSFTKHIYIVHLTITTFHLVDNADFYDTFHSFIFRVFS